MMLNICLAFFNIISKLCLILKKKKIVHPVKNACPTLASAYYSTVLVKKGNNIRLQTSEVKV